MAEKSEGAEALLPGIAAEMAEVVRRQFDALKAAPVATDPAAVDKALKAVITLGRATLIVHAVKAAEDKLAQERDRQAARRAAQLEQMDMNDITPDELEQRAAQLRARADRILALIEAKCVRPDVAGAAAGEHGVVAEPHERRAA